MISARNTVHPLSNADLHDAVGPEALTARIAMEAVNLRQAVAENRSRHFATLLMIAAFTSSIDLTQFEREPT